MRKGEEEESGGNGEREGNGEMEKGRKKRIAR